jgi:hypothetical protein
MLVNIDHQLLGYVKTTRSFSIQNFRSRRGRDRMVIQKVSFFLFVIFYNMNGWFYGV